MEKKRNIGKVIPLENGWILKVSLFSRSKEIGLGVTRKEWLSEGNHFTSKILLSQKASDKLVRTLQQYLARLRYLEKVKEEKSENES